MSDLAAAQREARRRKITQNAQARMNKLLGRPDITENNYQETNSVTSQPTPVRNSLREEEDQPKSQPPPQPEPESSSPTQSSPYNLRRRPRRSESPATPAPADKTVTQSVPASKPAISVNDKSVPTSKPAISVNDKSVPTSKPAITVNDKSVPTSKPAISVNDKSVPTSKPAISVNEETKAPDAEVSKCVPTPDLRNERSVPGEQTDSSAASVSKLQTQGLLKTENQPHTSFDAKAVDLLRIVACIMTSLISRWILSFGFGLFMVESIFLPFFAMEGFFVYIQETYLKDVSPVQSQGTMMSAALMLCGIKPELMGVYQKIMSHVAMVTSDFSMYFFSFVMWNALMT